MYSLHNDFTETIMEWLKTFGYFVSVFTFDYLGIPEKQLTILGILMVIDTFTGISKQWRIDPRWITSHIWWLWVLKKIVTVCVVYILALLGQWVWIPAGHFIEWGISILIMSEWYSALQNIYAVRTGKVLPEYDVISILLKKLWTLIKERIDSMQPPSSKE